MVKETLLKAAQGQVVNMYRVKVENVTGIDRVFELRTLYDLETITKAMLLACGGKVELTVVEVRDDEK